MTAHPPLTIPTLADIEQARARIAGVAIRTPLIRLYVDAPVEIWLKLECLQPIGSFKLRGATNAMRKLSRERLARGVYTASAGNMAQGVAWGARELGVPCTVVVPESAPRAKLDAIERLGARIRPAPFDEWWRTMREHGHPEVEGTFVHPFADADVLAGNGTVGLEILEDLPDVDAVLVPWGGGGLASGIAAAVRQARPDDHPPVFACEVETAAPLATSLDAGAPMEIQYTPSFVDGIGAGSLLSEMWPLASELIAGSLVVSVADVAAAVRLLVQRARVVPEGAGAAAVAAALSTRSASSLGIHAPGHRSGAPTPKVACIVSGGNIDLAKLAVILGGGVP